MKRHSFTVALLAALLSALSAGLLTACGGGGGSNGSAMGASEPPSTAPAADSFTAAVAALFQSTADSTEPMDVENTALTKPDSGEPVALE